VAQPRGAALKAWTHHRRRGHGKDQRKGFTEAGCAQLLDAAHQQPGGPLVVVWDNLKCATRRYGIEWG
jgi:putative transposase